MADFGELLTSLSNGNLSSYQAVVKKMAPRELALFSYWLHFVATEYFGDVLVTRAFLHNKLSFEVNNHGSRSKEKYFTIDSSCD